MESKDQKKGLPTGFWPLLRSVCPSVSIHFPSLTHPSCPLAMYLVGPSSHLISSAPSHAAFQVRVSIKSPVLSPCLPGLPRPAALPTIQLVRTSGRSRQDHSSPCRAWVSANPGRSQSSGQACGRQAHEADVLSASVESKVEMGAINSHLSLQIGVQVGRWKN